MFQTYSVILTTLDIFRDICPHLGTHIWVPTFGYILADSEIFRILTHLDIFVYTQAYSEQLKCLARFRHYSRAIHAYSERYLGRFRHI